MARPILEAPKKIVYSLVPKARHDELMEFMGKYFYTAETISKALNLFPGGVLPAGAQKVYRHRLSYGTTLYATEEDTNKIVGALVTSTVTAEQDAIFMEFLQQARTQNPKPWDKFMTYKKSMMNGCTSLQELTGCNKIYDMHDLLVVPEYRKYGIARELTCQSVVMAEKHDYEIMMAYPTTIATYKIISKIGFEIITQAKMKDIILDGKPLLDDPEAFVAIMGYRTKKSKPQ